MSCGNRALLGILEEFVDEAIRVLAIADSPDTNYAEVAAQASYALRVLNEGVARLSEVRGRLKHALD